MGKRINPRDSRNHKPSSGEPLKAWLLYAAPLLIALVVLWTRHIGGEPVEKDEQQTVQMALNLWQGGTVSLDPVAPLKPSMQREPLPTAITALAVGMTDAVMGKAGAQAYMGGTRARWLRLQNVLWFTLLCASVFGIVYSATLSPVLALVGTGLVGVLPFTPGVVFRVDQLDTESLAAGLLLMSSFWMAVAIHRGRLGAAVAAGAAFGLLALVKAATLYIFIGLIATLVFVCVLGPLRASIQRHLRSIAVMSLVFAVVVLPWMVRNHIYFGTFEIANRSAGVLYVRALKNGVTPTEYRGAFYVWAPSPLRGAVGKVLGFSRADMMRGGSLQRLNREGWSDFADDDMRAQLAGRPEDVISFYRRGQAEMFKARNELVAAGDPDPGTSAERAVRKRALNMIVEHPGKHLAVTIPFMWRGAVFTFPLLVLAMVYGIRDRRDELALLALPAFGTVMFYALLTHFIPRYGSTVWPVAITTLCMVIAAWRESRHGAPAVAPHRMAGS
ncbi:MAG: hypothetical protein ABI885_02870 [Gammaproteobacteria bacterium]